MDIQQDKLVNERNTVVNVVVKMVNGVLHQDCSFLIVQIFKV